MRNFFLIFLLLMLYVTPSAGQVAVDNKIRMTGPHDSLRQIHNTAHPIDTLNGLNASHLTGNNLIFGSASGIDSITVTINPAPTSYSKGMRVGFKAISNNTKSVYLRVNNLPWIQFRDHNGELLIPASITSNDVIFLEYDGTYFRLTDDRRIGCPAGFIAVNEHYCIEINERPPVVNSQAILNCYDLEARLCTWQEWYYACQKTSLNLQNMTNNWEWIDDTSNHTNTMCQNGNLSCQSNRAITVPTTLTFNYRCCYSR